MPLAINKKIQINALPSVVFDAITDPDKMVRFYPIDSVKSEGVVGGAIILSGKNNVAIFTDYGTIVACDFPYEFSYTYWSDNHGTARSKENHMTIQYLLSGDNNVTTLLLRHENLLTEERRSEMSNAWEYLLAQLKDYAEQV